MEELIPWVVGAIGVPLVGLLKNRLGWDGKKDDCIWLSPNAEARGIQRSLF